MTCDQSYKCSLDYYLSVLTYNLFLQLFLNIYLFKLSFVYFIFHPSILSTIHFTFNIIQLNTPGSQIGEKLFWIYPDFKNKQRINNKQS